MTITPKQAAQPRLYSRHQRHASFAKMRYSAQKQAFLDQQANRLGVTEAQLFADLAIGANRFKHEGAHETPGDSAERIEETANKNNL